MKHVVAALVVSFLAFASVSQVDAWTPPDECADEDREIAGNRSSPCKLALPEDLQDIRYGVVMEYPNCVEEISFSVPGARSSANDVKMGRLSSFGRFDSQKGWFRGQIGPRGLSYVQSHYGPGACPRTFVGAHFQHRGEQIH